MMSSWIARKVLIPQFFLLLLGLSSCVYLTGPPPDHQTLVNQIISKSGEIARTSPANSLIYLDSAFRSIENPGIGDKYARLEFKRNLYADTLKELDHSLRCADSVLLLLAPFSNDTLYQLKYAMGYLEKGDILFRMHLFNEAYAAYFDGRSALEKVSDLKQRARFLYAFYSQLGNISYGKEEFEQSAEWQKRAFGALNSFTGIPNRSYLMQGALDNIALSYSLAGNLDSALVYYNNALHFIQKIEKPRNDSIRYLEIAKGVILGNRGAVYARQKKTDLAEADYLTSIALNSKPGNDNEDALITRGKLAALYLNTGRLSAAGKQVHLIETNVCQPKMILNQQQFRLLRANYYTAIGKIEVANLELKKYISVSDSVQTANKSLYATNFGTEFELLKRQYDLKKLSRKSEMQDFYLFAALIICTLAGVIIYLVLRNSRQNKRNARLLTEHNLQLEATLSALEKSNSENLHLMGIVAHDLKNPVSAIISISTMLLEEGMEGAENNDMLKMIKTSGENLHKIIHNILAARLNNVNQEAPAEKLAIYDLLYQCASLLQFRADEKEQKISLADRDNICVLVNREKVWRVINNLIVNAIKFSPENTIIDIYWRVEKQMVIVSIKDQGIGVPASLKEKIFKVATEAKRKGTSGEQPFGLGLFISRQLIEEQGGSLWLENDNTSGATFSFSLPVCDSF